MKCPLCNKNAEKAFNGTVLGKYEITYYECPYCGFGFAERPTYWLDEAYATALASEDTGVMLRNINNAMKINFILDYFYSKDASFVDYGAGYGLFVRLMRDLGYNFQWEDKYALPLLCKGFEFDGEKKDLVTCFEVFEHMVDPLGEIQKLQEYGKEILFTTGLFDYNQGMKSNWSYLCYETGQHISFYSEKSLMYIAHELNMSYFSFGGYGFFSQRKISITDKIVKTMGSITKSYEKKFLKELDYKYAIRDADIITNGGCINECFWKSVESNSEK